MHPFVVELRRGFVDRLGAGEVHHVHALRRDATRRVRIVRILGASAQDHDVLLVRRRQDDAGALIAACRIAQTADHHRIGGIEGVEHERHGVALGIHLAAGEEEFGRHEAGTDADTRAG